MFRLLANFGMNPKGWTVTGSASLWRQDVVYAAGPGANRFGGPRCLRVRLDQKKRQKWWCWNCRLTVNFVYNGWWFKSHHFYFPWTGKWGWHLSDVFDLKLPTVVFLRWFDAFSAWNIRHHSCNNWKNAGLIRICLHLFSSAIGKNNQLF